MIELNDDFSGIDVHMTDQRTLGGGALQTVAGLAYDDLQQARMGYLNYVGNELGVQGELRLDEANHVYDFDQYLQAQWDPDPRWRLTAGVRNNLVEVNSTDDLPGAELPYSSVRYAAVEPGGGALCFMRARRSIYTPPTARVSKHRL